MNREVGFPKTLIQIHYHDRPCGVMQVIRHYAKAFENITGAGSLRNILIVDQHGEEEYPEFPEGSILPLPEAGYRTFKNQTAFLSARKKIIAKIASLLLSENMRLPVAVVAHNLTLCKNAALVSAFAELARVFALRNDERRFFSVAHDFAEEGRVDRLIEIHRLERGGIAIRKEIAAAGAPVHFLAVNPRAKKAFDRAGFHASLLVNPVGAEPVAGKRSGAAKKLLIKRLSDYSGNAGITFNPNRPVYVCPARSIIRKNPFEAIAVACIINDANLLLGGAGSTAADHRRHARIKKLARQFRLPVHTDVQKVIMESGPARRYVGNNPVPLLYGGADTILTCAVTEGFGYLLHEPWLYDTPVCGRRPIGFEFFGGKAGAVLYDSLPVPAAWTDTAVVLKKYEMVAGRCFPGKKQRQPFMREVEKKLSREFVDFAFLDEESQIDLMMRLLSSAHLRGSWLLLLEKPQSGWPGLSSFRLPAASGVREIRKNVEKIFSRSTFTGRFRECLRIIPEAQARTADWAPVEKEYGNAGAFRIS